MILAIFKNLMGFPHSLLVIDCVHGILALSWALIDGKNTMYRKGGMLNGVAIW